MATQTYDRTDGGRHGLAEARDFLARIACIPMLLLVLALMVIRPDAFRPDE